MITFKVEVEQEEDGRWLAEFLSCRACWSMAKARMPRCRRYRH